MRAKSALNLGIYEREYCQLGKEGFFLWNESITIVRGRTFLVTNPPPKKSCTLVVTDPLPQHASDFSINRQDFKTAVLSVLRTWRKVYSS